MDRRNFLKFSTAGALAMGCCLNMDGRSQKVGKAAAPIKYHADVVVCGGGPSGIGAAIEAARCGASVILVEHAGFLGGTWTAGLLGVMLDHRNKTGILKELKDTIVQRHWRTEVETGHLFTFNVERMKLLLDELCEKEHVKVLLYTSIVDATTENGRITQIITESRSGREAISGRIFVDATGDGDVAAMSGCGFDWGDEQGNTQPMSMLGLITGAKFEEISECVLWDGPNRSATKPNLMNEIRKGGYEATYKRPCLFVIDKDLYALMACHQYGFRCTSREDLTKASIEGRKEVNRIVDALQSLGGRWQNLRLVATASQIGCREGRRVHGLYTVTQDDLLKGRRFEDAACEVKFGVDIHSVQLGHEGAKSYNHGLKSQPYDIPLKALIPKDVKGLLLTGRCISGDFVAHSSYRVNSNSVLLGQTAGRMAARSLKENKELVDIHLHYSQF